MDVMFQIVKAKTSYMHVLIKEQIKMNLNTFVFTFQIINW